MDQSASLQDQDEVWLAKLAMLGCTVDTYASYYFVYTEGRLTICGQNLPSVAQQVIENIQKGLYT